MRRIMARAELLTVLAGWTSDQLTSLSAAAFKAAVADQSKMPVISPPDPKEVQRSGSDQCPAGRCLATRQSEAASEAQEAAKRPIPRASYASCQPDPQPRQADQRASPCPS